MNNYRTLSGANGGRGQQEDGGTQTGGNEENAPPAPRDPSQRKINVKYWSPKGYITWDGKGWRKAQ